MLVDNTCTFKHVYKVRVFRMVPLITFLQPQNLAVTLFSKKNKSEHWISCGAHVEEGLNRVSITSSQQ